MKNWLKENWENFQKTKWFKIIQWIYFILLIFLIFLAIYIIWQDSEINFYEDVIRDWFRGGSGGSPYGDSDLYFNE